MMVIRLITYTFKDSTSRQEHLARMQPDGIRHWNDRESIEIVTYLDEGRVVNCFPGVELVEGRPE